MKYPTSSRLITNVVDGLERSSGAPTFDRIQKAVRFAESAAPMINKMGVSSETHELEQLLQQTLELGLLFEYDGMYMVTGKAKEHVLT